MASITFISNYLSSSSSSSTSCSSTHHLTQTYKPFSSPSTLPFIHGNKKSSRGLSVVTKGGGPSSTSYIFAFIFPISLVAVTIFTAMRITDELDQKFLEELAVNQEILEAGEEDGDRISSEEKPAVPRKRNRPKREVEPSSK
nr:uncharacterized protein LOC113727219 [Coffea arabica]